MLLFLLFHCKGPHYISITWNKILTKRCIFKCIFATHTFKNYSFVPQSFISGSKESAFVRKEYQLHFKNHHRNKPLSIIFFQLRSLERHNQYITDLRCQLLENFDSGRKIKKIIWNVLKSWPMYGLDIVDALLFMWYDKSEWSNENKIKVFPW